MNENQQTQSETNKNLSSNTNTSVALIFIYLTVIIILLIFVSLLKMNTLEVSIIYFIVISITIFFLYSRKFRNDTFISKTLFLLPFIIHAGMIFFLSQEPQVSTYPNLHISFGFFYQSGSEYYFWLLLLCFPLYLLIRSLFKNIFYKKHQKFIKITGIFLLITQLITIYSFKDEYVVNPQDYSGFMMSFNNVWKFEYYLLGGLISIITMFVFVIMNIKERKKKKFHPLKE